MPWTAREISKTFANETSIHGIGRIENAKFIIHKLFWLMVFFASLGMLIYQVTRLGQQYASHPVNTKITVHHGKQKFPAITFCNLNPVMYSKVLFNRDLNQLVDALIESAQVNRSVFVDPNKYPQYNYTTEVDLGIFEPFETGKKLFLSKLASLTNDELRELSTEFQDEVLECKLYNTPCGESNFDRVRSDDYGFCFQLKTNELISEIAGPGYGLQVLFNVRQKEYVPFMTQSAGVRIIVHHPDYPPDFVDGFNAPTGFEIDIGVYTSHTHRLEGPDKRCDPKDTYSSLMSCIRQCIGEAVTSTCGCASNFDYTTDDHTEVCSNLKDWECIEQYQLKLKPEDHCSHCKQPCRETTYHTAISMTKWPSKNYAPIMESIIKEINKDSGTARDDFLQFRVFFSHLASQNIEEEEAYTAENFVSDIGGQLGLWCGLSVLSCIEVVEFFCFLIASRIMPRNKTKDDRKEEKDIKKLDDTTQPEAKCEVGLKSIY